MQDSARNVFFFFSALLTSIVFILCLHAFKPHCFVSLLKESWCGAHPYTHGQNSCEYSGSTFQSKNLEFPMAAWLLECLPGTGEDQVCFAT